MPSVSSSWIHSVNLNQPRFLWFVEQTALDSNPFVRGAEVSKALLWNEVRHPMRRRSLLSLQSIIDDFTSEVRASMPLPPAALRSILLCFSRAHAVESARFCRLWFFVFQYEASHALTHPASDICQGVPAKSVCARYAYGTTGLTSGVSD